MIIIKLKIAKKRITWRVRGKKVFFLLLLYGFIFRPALSWAQADKRFNVLFFLVDDLRPDLGCYGDPIVHTPNIDAIADKGVVFQRAYCQQAVCNPSRASMLTGLRPDEEGVTNLQVHFREKVPGAVTLPQAFKNNGYTTTGIGKVFHTEKSTLDPVSWTTSLTDFGKGNYVLPQNMGQKGKRAAAERADVADTAYVDGVIAENAVRFLKQVKPAGGPFFLAVGFRKPHAPYCAPEKYWGLYQREQFALKQRQRPVSSPPIAFHNNEEIRGYNDIPDSGLIADDKQLELIHGYYACISYVDAQIGKVLKTLKEQGLTENTIIVLWGDHGYHLGEQGSWCKSTNFELDARVPLIIAAPGQKENGRQLSAIVETIDIYPTLLDLCNLQPATRLSGSSLKPLLNGNEAQWSNRAFSQFVRPYQSVNIKHPPTHMGYSVRVDQWRCTYWYDLHTNNIVAKELYRLDGNRVIETENISGKREARETEAKLAAWIDTYRAGKYRKGP
ncbi:MAG: sulfatase [Niabella sp.]